MIGRKLLAMQHLEELHPQIVPQHLVHGEFAHTDCGGPGLQLRGGFCRSFFLVFLRSWEEWTLRFLPRPGRSRVFPVSWNFLTILNGSYPAVCNFHITFFIFWSLITAFLSTVIVKLTFENFGITILKVEIVSLQMVIILRKLTTLKEFCRKTKLGCLNLWTPCMSNYELVNRNSILS